MPSQSSNIIIGLQVNLKGAVGLDKLNAALKLIKQTTQSLQRGGTGSGMAAQMTNLARGAGVGASAVRKLTMAERDAERQAARNRVMWSKEAEDLKTLAGRLRQAETRFDAIFRAGFRLQMIGRQVMQFGQSILSSLGDVVGEFGNFEFMVNRASGAMGILQTEVDKGKNLYQEFQSAIFDTASTLRLFDPTEVAKATYFWASTTGQQVNTLSQLKSVMTSVIPIMQAAAMTQTDYETAIKGVYSIITEYGLSLSRTADITQKLFEVTQLTSAEFPDLINSFKMVGPIAKANNVTFEDMVDLFGRLADSGIRGTMVGRAFRQMFIQLVRPSAKAADALDVLWKGTRAFGGKSYLETVFPKGEFIGVNNYIHLLAVALKDLTTQQRNQLLGQITTANELPVLTSLVNKEIYAIRTGTQVLSKNAQQHETAAQIFARSWDVLRDSWNGAIGALQRGVEIIRIEIGGRLAKIFRPTIDQITAALGDLRKWFEDARNGPIIDFFIKVVGFGALFITVAGAVVLLVGSLTSLAAGATVAVLAFGKLVPAFSLSIGAIGGIISAIIRNADYLKKAFISASEDIASAFGGTGGLRGVMQQFNDYTRPLFDFLVRSLADIIRSIGSLVKGLMSFGPTAFILEAVGKAMIVLFAARTANKILGLAKAFNVLKLAIMGGTVFRREKDILGNFSGVVVQEKYVGVLEKTRKAAAGAAGGMSKLRAGTLGLTAAGKGLLAVFGGPLGIIALVATIAGLAYESNFLGFKDGIDALTHSFKDFKQEVKDSADALGDWAGRVTAAGVNDPRYKALQDKIDSLGPYGSNPKGMFGIDAFGMGGGKVNNDAARNKLLNQQREFLATYQQQWVTLTDEIGRHMKVSLDDVLTTTTNFSRLLGTDLQGAIPLVQEFYRLQYDGAQLSEAGLTDLYNKYKWMMSLIGKNISFSLSDFLKISQGDQVYIQNQAETTARQLLKTFEDAMSGSVSAFGTTDTGLTKALASQTLAELQNLADSGGLSDDLTKVIRDIISTSIANGLPPDPATLDNSVVTLYSDISKKLIDGASALKDVDKQLREAIKNDLKPEKLFSSIIQSFRSGVLGRGFGGSQAGRFAAIGIFQSLNTQIEEVQKTFTPPAFTAWSKKIVKGLAKDLKGLVLPKTTTDEMRQQFQDAITTVFTNAGQAVPTSILEAIWGTSKHRDEHLPSKIKTDLTQAGRDATAAFIAGMDERPRDTSDPVAHLAGLFRKGKAGGKTGGKPGESIFTPPPPDPVVLAGVGAKIVDGIWGGMRDSISQKWKDDPFAGIYNNMPAAAYLNGGVVGQQFLSGLMGNEPLISATAIKIGDDVLGMNKYAGNTFLWGSDMGANFLAGLKVWEIPIVQLANRIASSLAGIMQHSSPKTGPLKGDDQWFYHLGMNLADGLARSHSAIRTQVSAIADTMSVGLNPAMNPGVSIDTSSKRAIKVQVEVTSPDGSVDHVKASELQRGLQTSDLILSLEHMAGVG